ncbi:MAG TPA: hypothetical protein VF412_17805 [Bdellovibrio sp.]|uniref:hypothetical protein n=1 Tax=Bdellovibrio sp. TaxID=28201 RepID=UPI002F1B6D20
MKQIGFIFLAVVVSFVVISSSMSVKQAQANPLLLAAPVVAIGSLDVVAMAATAAAAAGVITMAQNQEFQESVSQDISRIKEATADTIDETMNGAIALLKKIDKLVKPRQCTTSQADGKNQQCDQILESCCQDFLKKFENQMKRGKGGITIVKGKNKFQCCLEWDYVHGGLEIFDERGNHLGEKGCDDLSDDPCRWTKSRGAHAAPNSSTHKPRTATCSP